MMRGWAKLAVLPAKVPVAPPLISGSGEALPIKGA